MLEWLDASSAGAAGDHCNSSNDDDREESEEEAGLLYEDDDDDDNDEINDNDGDGDDDDDDGDQQQLRKGVHLDEDRFIAFHDDASWVQVAKKNKSTHAANMRKNATTIQQCFNTFTKPERLDENNQWYCSNCKNHVRAMKTMELWRLPNVLVLHLKRFEFKHALRRDKLDTLVDFPLEGLDMTNHCSSTKESTFVDAHVPAVYDLFAVVNHYGRMGFGHYTAFARQWDETGISPEWNVFDDSTVQSIGNGKGGGNQNVVSPAAYVLFYRRRMFHP